MGNGALGKIANWTRKAIDRIKEDGLDGLYWAVIKFYGKFFMKRVSDGVFNFRGRPIYERDWDVLIILDACRADFMSEVKGDYPFVSENSTISNASNSRLWHERNFNSVYSDEMARTVLVSGNTFSGRVLSDEDFLQLDRVWEYAWDDEYGVMPARPITDRAITAARNHDPDRLIVHYMQPHMPPIPYVSGNHGEDEPIDDRWLDAWKHVQNGEISIDEAWGAHVENLRYVLDDVALLLENIDAERVAISADHGNAFGEHGFYRHPGHIPIRALREVPWCITSATDTGEYEPPEYDVESRGNVEEKLAALGYK
ncbi:hypothetical protein [Halorientalis halophila]|uniref:hypothetical protein n=1 Tax=Halorientalis halophila TaxID=3108499 RepID=UPI0030087054